MSYREAHLPSTVEPISIQSRKNDNLDINKTTGNIRSRILDNGKDTAKRLVAFEKKSLKKNVCGDY
jgi:hypothetical protein